MRVAIRTDASAAMGGGHVKRCLALAHALRAAGLEPLVLSRALDEVGPALLASVPFEVRWLAGDAAQDASRTAELAGNGLGWLVVDHYGLDAAWHEKARALLGCHIAVIDDLANRPLAADLLLDANDPDAATNYRRWLTRPCKVLGGPRYVLLSPEYLAAPRYRAHDQVRSIGIFMGTTDPTGACLDALEAVRQIAGFVGEVEVVCSRAAPRFAQLAQACANWPGTRLVESLPDLAGFYARHDLQIGAGGGAAWERCCIGAPAVACMVAPNQMATLPRLQAWGAVRWARGEPGEHMAEAIAAEVLHLMGDAAARLALSEAAGKLVDGRGAPRVAAVMALLARAPLRLRDASAADEALLLEWANDPVVRANAFNPQRIGSQAHEQWFRARLNRPAQCTMLIAEAANGEPVGQVRLELDGRTWEIGYSIAEPYRGLGLASGLLRAAMARVPAGHEVIGRVKAGNEPSARAFSKLGFCREEVLDERGRYLLFRFPAGPGGRTI